METCRTCRFASIMRQQCRRESPQVFPVLTREGPLPFTAFPALPPSGEGCGEHQSADALEIAAREAAEVEASEAKQHAVSPSEQSLSRLPIPRLVTP